MEKHTKDCNLIKNNGMNCLVDHAPGYECSFNSCTCSRPIEPQKEEKKCICGNPDKYHEQKEMLEGGFKPNYVPMDKENNLSGIVLY